MRDISTPLIIIPARMASTRLPNKPLADIGGTPMIVHVWRRAQEAQLGRVVVAAAEQDIIDVIEAAGGEAIITDRDLPSGTDRIHQAAQKIDPDKTHTIIINLQGDLPSLDPHFIARTAQLLQNADMSSLAAQIHNDTERDNPNVVKAVIAFDDASCQEGRALYFTRATAPSGEGALYHHIGIYGFRRAILDKFVALSRSPLEQRERLEQLRALEAGFTIRMGIVDKVALGVDTKEDLQAAREILQESL